MTSYTGGRIPPDGRPSQAPGIGKTARRHDLERQPTPGLEDSSLQYGDVQRLENAQRVAPIRDQPPARPGMGAVRSGGAPSTGATGGPPFQAPDPVQFAKDRLSGTLTEGRASRRTEMIDTGPWLGLLRKMANAPRSSGALRNAMVETMGRLVQSPVAPHSILADLDQLDEDLGAFADGLSR